MQRKEGNNNLIDVNKLIEDYTVEELCKNAEVYFNTLTNWDYHLSKPFDSIEEAPDLLINFSHLIHGLKLLPNMIVLDFGAGSCWTSRFINQMGCSIISVDVSITALKIGEKLIQQQPVFGNPPAHTFLYFNGRKLDLPNESVDRIFCFDAFHHVPNQFEVLSEMFRVLKQGGIAGFSEPGPDNSKSPQSQYEMNSHKVIENDIKVKEIFEKAKKVGFTDIKISIFCIEPSVVSLKEFESIFDRNLISEYFSKTFNINYMKNHRTFFLYKGDGEISDSRTRIGLLADMKINLKSSIINEIDNFEIEAIIKNNSNLIWLPSGDKRGSVNLGVHLLNRDNSMINLDYFRYHLSTKENKKIMPEEEINIRFRLPSPKIGMYRLEFDLVSESVC